jgi:hypothetical protein
MAKIKWVCPDQNNDKKTNQRDSGTGLVMIERHKELSIHDVARWLHLLLLAKGLIGGNKDLLESPYSNLRELEI